MARKALIFAVILAVGLCFTAPASQAQTFLRMFSGPEGGSWYPLGSAMMGIVEKNLRGSPPPTAPAAAWATARRSTPAGPTGLVVHPHRL